MQNKDLTKIVFTQDNNMEFFKEENGRDSSARLIFIIGMIWSMLFTTILTFVAQLEVTSIIALFSANSGVFIALKLGQKSMETKP